MITKTINDNTFVFCEVSEFSDRHNLHEGMLRSTFILNCKADQVENDLQQMLPIDGEYKIIGKANELTEDQWQGIVEQVEPNQHTLLLKYKSYCGEPMPYGWAMSSGLSLLTSLNLKPETTLILEKV